MSKEYREETVMKYEETIENILRDSPTYIRDFYNHMHNGKREITTQAAYIRDIISFISYLRNTIPSLHDLDLKSFPLNIFDQIVVKDLNEYRTFLHTTQKLSNSSIKKKFAAISAFYKFGVSEKYVENNPMTNFELPAINKHRIIKLNSDMSNRLLAGILKNDKFLVSTPLGEEIKPIDEKVYLKREPLVLRNHAICCLFLGAGLRISELVGLDLNDINFATGTVNIIAKGGDEIQVYFGDEVAKALRAYLDGTPLPQDLVSKYMGADKAAFLWAKHHLADQNFKEKLETEFPNRTDSFYDDLIRLSASMRRSGRNGFNPASNCNAVFLSSRGTRMSVRMVELMIKEMVKTYLPDYDDKQLFSPHKLRATCATRILAQTGNIELASAQLNHKGIGVTAAFYAELQKENAKEQIRNLDITEW